MNIKNIFFSILLLIFCNVLLFQAVLAENVGMMIKKNQALESEENLYWAYAYDTSSDSSSAASSLIKLQVLTDHGLKDRFRVDKSGNLDSSGEIDANELCIKGSCQPSWPSGSLWTIKGDDELYYNTDYVGIGTSDPGNNLHIYQESLDNAAIYIQSTSASDSQWSIYHDNLSDDLRISHTGLADDLLTLSNEGMVGIGDISPSVKLSVNGGVKFGFTNTCEDGVLRFNSSKLEFCYSGAWTEFGK